VLIYQPIPKDRKNPKPKQCFRQFSISADTYTSNLYCRFIKFNISLSQRLFERVTEASTLVYRKKGLIRKGGKGKKGGEKIYIIIDDEAFGSVSIKALKAILNGTKKVAAIRGYD
jgi:hypothetical protein